MISNLPWLLAGVVVGQVYWLYRLLRRPKHVHQWGPWRPATVTYTGRIYPRAADGGPMAIQTECRECEECGEVQYQGE